MSPHRSDDALPVATPIVLSHVVVSRACGFDLPCHMVLATYPGACLQAGVNSPDNIELAMQGIVGSGAGYLIMTWCVEKKGPVFTAAFIPLMQIMVAIIDFFFLHEQIYLGSVLGSVLMILGLYLLLWGKKRDEATAKKQVDEQADDKP